MIHHNPWRRKRRRLGLAQTPSLSPAGLADDPRRDSPPGSSQETRTPPPKAMVNHHPPTLCLPARCTATTAAFHDPSCLALLRTTCKSRHCPRVSQRILTHRILLLSRNRPLADSSLAAKVYRLHIDESTLGRPIPQAPPDNASTPISALVDPRVLTGLRFNTSPFSRHVRSALSPFDGPPPSVAQRSQRRSVLSPCLPPPARHDAARGSRRLDLFGPAVGAMCRASSRVAPRRSCARQPHAGRLPIRLVGADKKKQAS